MVDRVGLHQKPGCCLRPRKCTGSSPGPSWELGGSWHRWWLATELGHHSSLQTSRCVPLCQPIRERNLRRQLCRLNEQGQLSFRAHDQSIVHTGVASASGVQPAARFGRMATAGPTPATVWVLHLFSARHCARTAPCLCYSFPPCSVCVRIATLVLSWFFCTRARQAHSSVCCRCAYICVGMHQCESEAYHVMCAVRTCMCVCVLQGKGAARGTTERRAIRG